MKLNFMRSGMLWNSAKNGTKGKSYHSAQTHRLSSIRLKRNMPKIKISRPFCVTFYIFQNPFRMSFSNGFPKSKMARLIGWREKRYEKADKTFVARYNLFYQLAAIYKFFLVILPATYNTSPMISMTYKGIWTTWPNEGIRN